MRVSRGPRRPPYIQSDSLTEGHGAKGLDAPLDGIIREIVWQRPAESTNFRLPMVRNQQVSVQAFLHDSAREAVDLRFQGQRFRFDHRVLTAWYSGPLGSSLA